MANTSFKLTLYPSGRIAQVIRPQVQTNILPRVNRVASAARSLAPVRTGRLRSSIRVRARGTGGTFSGLGGASICSYEVLAATPYAGYVTRGTAPHIIRVRRARVLTDGVNFFGPVVNHPGTAANPYLERALRVGFLRG